MVLGNFAAGQYAEPLNWISPHNWQRLIDYYAPLQTLPAAADTGTAGETPCG